MAPNIKISAAERAYRILRKQIVSLELKPNEAIGEQMLAEKLGVSRTPIREALTRLSAEGLVDVRSRSGVIVAPIRMEAVETAQFVREKLELAVISEAVRSPDRRIHLAIRQSIEEQEFAVGEGDVGLFFNSDEKMHQLFCELAGRAAVWTIISDAKKHMDRVRRLSLQDIDLTVLLQDHLQLLAAIGDGSERDAKAVMKTHLRRVMTDFANLIDAHPAYFEHATRADQVGDRSDNIEGATFG